MKLEKLLASIKALEVKGDLNKEISGVNIDSRLIEKDHLFFAVKGTQTHFYR